MATSNFVPPVVFHPGITLSEKLNEMRMSVKEFAVRTSKPEKTIFAIIKGDSAVTSDMAVAFETVTKIPAGFWLKRQRSYDEYVARNKREAMMESACCWAKKFPFSKMAELGWVSPCKNIKDKVKELFTFFQISTPKAWEDYYFNQHLKVAFRISLCNMKEPYAISAWLRKGELQAATQSAATYSEKLLREKIPSMKALMIEETPDFPSRLKETCAEAGIKLVYTPCLPKAPINGSTRWINNTPCVQLTGRHKRYDIFWFTFFHEIGHILLHGKKDIFLEDVEYSDIDMEKEAEADNFASKTLLTHSEEEEIVANGDYSASAIRKFAKKFNTHPAIIVGRLQYKKVISFSKDNDLLPKIDLFSENNVVKDIQ